MKLLTTTSCLALALAIAGCKISSDYGNTRYRCDMSGQCPDGFACVNGYCETDGDAGVDRDGGVSNKACGVVEMAVEDFEAPEIDWEHWDGWVDDPALITSHVNGQLAFEFPAGSSQGHDHYTRDIYEFRDSRAYIEVVDAQPDSDVGLYFWLAVDDWEDRWFMRQRGGTLSFMYRIDGMDFNIGSVSYDPVAHRWWQLREQDGTVYWETSPDAVSWTSHAMASSDLIAPRVLVILSTWLETPEETPRIVLVDNLNGGVDPGIRWCPASTLTDDFDDGVMDLSWGFWDHSNCKLQETDGQLAFEYTQAGYGDCGYYSLSPLDLSNSTFVVQAPAADVGAMYVIHGVYSQNTDPRDQMEIWQGYGELGGWKKVQGTGSPTFKIPFDPVQHRWWRLRGENGIAYWETSADGQAWITHASHSNPPLQLDKVDVDLWSYSDEGGLSNIGNGFDNVNLAP